jgi:hypothetical protein
VTSGSRRRWLQGAAVLATGPWLAHAAPAARAPAPVEAVPGGVALLPLGRRAQQPQAALDGVPVLVRADSPGHWQAVVGL